MSEFSLLNAVMEALGQPGNSYLEPVIEHYISDINEYLTAAGVPSDLIGTEITAGAVTRGVADIWNLGSGDGKLSPYFYERVTQLATTVKNM